MDIIQRNFFKLIRSGAFDDKSIIEVMSPFKWRRLYEIVLFQNVLDYFVRGVNNYANDKNLNLPAELIEEIQKKLDQQEERKTTDNGINLSNGLLNKKYHKIIHNELHSIDTSVETLDILKLIVSNTNAMLNHGINLDNIIRLGQYLRKKGDKVDFLKLEGWMSSLHLQRMAQLQGSILIAVFGFEKDEIDFVKKEEPIAYKLTIKIISNLVKDTAGEWHFRQNSAGFVQNNGKMLRRNLRRSYKYINYAPLETTSNFINGFIRGLSEIEE